MIQQTRIEHLNNKSKRHGDYVLYWMQASQRSEYNHALEFAIQQANELHQPVVAYFGLTDRYPEANQRHYWFMLQGIQEVESSLKDRTIRIVIGYESPETGVIRMAERASVLVCDCGYLRLQRQWRRHVSQEADCPVIEVESDVIVPVRETSSKEEYSAATLRPKIKRQLAKYLVPLEQSIPQESSLHLRLESQDIGDIGKVLSKLNIDRSVPEAEGYSGGASEARRRLREFIKNRLNRYPEERNDPTTNCLSGLSPYLHFGQISPLEIALEVNESDNAAKDVYLEELIVRRELSINYVYYNPDYDSFKGLPEWSKKTLQKHKSDNRAYTYSLKELENATTHDDYWNAAQKEMVITGKMHGYMRMYWGKKILEWSPEPEEAYRTALYLNNKYELDGRDPNGFAGVAWCFGKHDRPWATRSIFGNIRFMSFGGLRRKFDADRYAAKYSVTIPENPSE
jgi:deoxyribodipyrimidine photo-lyase